MTAVTLEIPSRHAPAERRTLALILASAVLMFVVLQGGLNLLIPRIDLTWSSLIVTAAMLSLVVLIERLAFRRTTLPALAALGFGRPNPAALVAAGIIAAVMLAFFPIYALATGTAFSLRADWLWVLVGAIAL